MKVAVITPHWNTAVLALHRNIESVANQKTNHDVHHFLIADGYNCDQQDAVIKSFPNTTHIRLPVDCDDVGATPSVIGAYVARALGYEAFMFLGDDNIFLDDHVESCVNKHLNTQAEVVVARRFFMTPDGEQLHIPEEPGHVDANCLALFGRSIRYAHMMTMMPKPLLEINDRIFRQVLMSRFKFAFTDKATVGYTTKWASHYRYLGREVPSWAKENAGRNAQIWFGKCSEDVKKDWMDYLIKT